MSERRKQSRLPRFGKDWRMRWLQFPNRGTLHRVASVSWSESDAAGYGVTACSQFNRLVMPGLFSRMGAPRCRQCCAIAGVPQGSGAPFNEGIDA